MTEPRPRIVAVSASGNHSFSKPTLDEIRLVPGLGVEGDAHFGATVKHRSRVAVDPTRPNLRQVHLIHGELHDELNAAGFSVAAGDLGENLLTRGLDLLALPTGSRLRIGPEAVVELTGLRNPCRQLDNFQQGLMAATLERTDDGSLVRKAGVMAVVVTGGPVRPGDAIVVDYPTGHPRPLEPV
ncbi:MAG: MOSC domain-containing protein [Chloroflexota bacterium]